MTADTFNKANIAYESSFLTGASLNPTFRPQGMNLIVTVGNGAYKALNLKMIQPQGKVSAPLFSKSY